MRRGIFLFIVASLIVFSSSAVARNTFHDLPVSEAVKSVRGKEKLLDIPFYMAGQRYPAVKKDLGVFESNKRTNALNKSDEEACRIAFLSAIISLQKRAQRMGADGVVDIRSITKHKRLVSARKYRCAAGDLMANVALTGRVVNFSR
ncbi:MAG: hypothetical protein OEV42_07950 [Deltaproteobacteria bacterium]|nr:hypothetical protein [Deltaproteobacteria bacterium]